MAEADVLRQLAQAFDDICMWRNLVALLPYTVRVDHAAERAEQERRSSRERAERLLTRIPIQRNREITLPRRTETRR